MKQTIIAAILALIASFSALAQSAPDHEAIASQVKSGQYATLLERFKAGQQLTPSEAATVYYGSALQPAFKPDRNIDKILAAYNSGALDQAFRMCEEALSTDPTNLQLLFKAYAAAASSKDAAIKVKAPKMQSRLLTICDAIFNSGAGVTESAPYYVIRPADIDEFLVKYMQPASIDGRASVGNLSAAKVRLDNIADEVILYFATFK